MRGLLPFMRSAADPTSNIHNQVLQLLSVSQQQLQKEGPMIPQQQRAYMMQERCFVR